jgi:hypothetical protein
MNIFVLDQDTSKAAEYHCDKHVVKMCLEYAQLLSTTANFYMGETVGYKSTHVNHPCSVWARQSSSNVRWLSGLLLKLGDQYTLRYCKVHKSVHVGVKSALIAMKKMPDLGLTPFAQAMPEQYKNEDPVVAYRDYYRKEKAGFATWKNKTPEWWTQTN